MGDKGQEATQAEAAVARRVLRQGALLEGDEQGGDSLRGNPAAVIAHLRRQKMNQG